MIDVYGGDINDYSAHHNLTDHNDEDFGEDQFFVIDVKGF